MLLLEKIKEAIPSFKQLQDDQIRVAYQDVQSQCYINIDSEDAHLHLLEAFRNCIACGSYERVQLKVWEKDSPFLLRKRPMVQRNDVNEEISINNSSVTCDSLPSKSSGPKAKSLCFSQSSTDLHPLTNWKKNKEGELSNKLQMLHDQKMAMETHIRELELNVAEPLPAGTYETICGNCHIRGHRADGNRRNDACNLSPCTSYYSCGQKKKHPEHFDEIKSAKKKLRDINKEIDSAEVERKNIESFQSKSISAFSSAVTPRLLKAFGDKYSLKTSKGKLILQKDIATLRAACENKIPEQTGNDRQLFTTLLEQQIAKMNDFSSSFTGRSYKATSSSSLHKTEINLNVSPITKSFEKQKSKRERYSSYDSDSSSKSSSTSTDSSVERRSKHKKGRRRRRIAKTSNKRKKSSRKQNKRKCNLERSSSSETDSDDITKSSGKTAMHYEIDKNKPTNVSFARSSLQKSACESAGEAYACSLDELATIAVTINNNKTQGDVQ